MNNLYLNSMMTMISNRKAELQLMIADKKKALKKAPAEMLRAIPHGKGYQYYARKDKKDKNGKYIKKKDLGYARRLAQKEYDLQILKLAVIENNLLMNIEEKYDQLVSPEAVYSNLPMGRKNLVNPIHMSDEEYLEKWRSVQYEGMGFYDDANVFYSQRGEAMRSKSEVIIAGILDKYDIPYKYEKPLFLEGYGQIRPDFTLLNLNKRSEIYLEHLGLLDEVEYCNKALLKIQAYEANGYFLGDTLFITAETYRHPLNISAVERRIKNMLKIR